MFLLALGSNIASLVFNQEENVLFRTVTRPPSVFRQTTEEDVAWFICLLSDDVSPQ